MKGADNNAKTVAVSTIKKRLKLKTLTIEIHPDQIRKMKKMPT